MLEIVILVLAGILYFLVIIMTLIELKDNYDIHRRNKIYERRVLDSSIDLIENQVEKIKEYVPEDLSKEDRQYIEIFQKIIEGELKCMKNLFKKGRR